MSMERIEEIRVMHPVVRIAGFLKHMAIVDEIGARLRTSKKDEEWTKEDHDEWDKACDDADPWHYALTDEEHILLKEIVSFTGFIGRGEMPSMQKAKEEIELSEKLAKKDEEEYKMELGDNSK